MPVSIDLRFRPCLCRFFCKRHGHLRPLPRNFDRAFDVFFQKARSATPFASRFRPCLCRFFAKGTVTCAPQPPISTVPLTIFCKRHGRPRPLPRDSDRAFIVFLQKARSRTTHNLRFRPCLCRFFPKGTVTYDPQPTISTVPFPFFCKRHGRSHLQTADFDRAFDVFFQKAQYSLSQYLLSWGVSNLQKRKPTRVGRLL